MKNLKRGTISHIDRHWESFLFAIGGKIIRLRDYQSGKKAGRRYRPTHIQHTNFNQVKLPINNGSQHPSTQLSRDGSDTDLMSSAASTPTSHPVATQPNIEHIPLCVRRIIRHYVGGSAVASFRQLSHSWEESTDNFTLSLTLDDYPEDSDTDTDTEPDPVQEQKQQEQNELNFWNTIHNQLHHHDQQLPLFWTFVQRKLLSNTSHFNHVVLHAYTKDITPLQPLTTLTHLDLTNNTINDITSLATLTKLVTLHLGCNHLNETHLTSLEKLCHLSSLDLHWNSLSHIDSLQPLARLTILNLSHNPIHTLAPLEQLKKLQTLNLNNCSSCKHTIDIQPLQELLHLQQVSLYNNRLEDISALAKLTTLTVLDLGRNKLSNIVSLQHLHRLTELQLNSNELHDVTPLRRLIHLHELNLNHNGIRTIQPLVDLVELRTLDLDFNQIGWQGNLTALQGMVELRHLRMGHNEIDSIAPVAGLFKLTEVHFYNNGVVDVGSLSSLTSLTVLDMGRNRIHDLNPCKNLLALNFLGLKYMLQISNLSPLRWLTNLKNLYTYGAGPCARDVTTLAHLEKLTVHNTKQE